jgi:inorganic pyrophosphatase
MSFSNISSGKDVPNLINVIIEIPANSAPVKYEVDKESGTLFVDRFLSTSMVYPVNYGYVPNTLSLDGDPVDVLVITPHPLVHGSVIPCRPIGVLRMTDESGEDAKVLAVPADKLTTLYRKVQTHLDVAPELLASIKHLFEHYKDLEPNKWVKVEGWFGPDEAKVEIMNSIAAFAKGK